MALGNVKPQVSLVGPESSPQGKTTAVTPDLWREDTQQKNKEAEAHTGQAEGISGRGERMSQRQRERPPEAKSAHSHFGETDTQDSRRRKDLDSRTNRRQR